MTSTKFLIYANVAKRAIENMVEYLAEHVDHTGAQMAIDNLAGAMCELDTAIINADFGVFDIEDEKQRGRLD